MNTETNIEHRTSNTEHPTEPAAPAPFEASTIEARGEATYSPEDNKLRLYVGRVPLEEFLKLRAEGWGTLHKQRETGGGDFAATWTPARRDTALAYSGGYIGDEDQGPAERAADRAERFSGYRDKRTDEAGNLADRYDNLPAAHGYQNAQRAERAAARHDRLGDRAGDAWSKAEYWTSRTAGVIAHALYKSRPDVRMGRIKTIEADLRRVSGSGGEWEKHLTLRLAYENQMLEAQGGRLASVEIVPGGRVGGKLIVKVNKSSATGRVVSVFLKGPKVTGWQYMTRNVPGADYSLHQFKTERMPQDAYTRPTEADLRELADLKQTTKASATKKTPCPLVNPSDADAERLQAVWNANAKAYIEQRCKETSGWTLDDFKPSEVLRTTQAVYSRNSKGAYCSAGTREVFAGGIECPLYYNAAAKMREKHGAPVCTVRRTSGGNYQASRVIILTDKPQKALPEAVWVPAAPAPVLMSQNVSVSAFA